MPHINAEEYESDEESFMSETEVEEMLPHPRALANVQAYSQTNNLACAHANVDNSVMIGVFDGHGEHGADLAQTVQLHLQQVVVQELADCDEDSNDVLDVLLASFERVQDTLQEDPMAAHSGVSTAMCLVVDNHLWTASVGDCRVVAIYTQSPEMDVIRSLTDETPVLGTSLGDTQEEAFSSLPKITCMNVDSHPLHTSCFIVCASKALWEVMSTEDVAAFLRKAVSSSSLDSSASPCVPSSSSLQAHLAHLLCEHAATIQPEEVQGSLSAVVLHHMDLGPVPSINGESPSPPPSLVDLTQVVSSSLKDFRPISLTTTPSTSNDVDALVDSLVDEIVEKALERVLSQV